MSSPKPSPASVLFQKTLCLLVSLIPWVLSMYLHYWLEYEGIWQVDMPFRAVMSAAILGAGLALSFLAHSFLVGRLSFRQGTR